MSKIVNWGRWIVATTFAWGGFELLFGKGVPDAIHALRGGQSFYPFYMAVLLCVVYLLCGWGILKWRNWGRKLAVGVSVVELVSLASVIATFGVHEFGGLVISSAVFVGAVLVWLLIPAVRVQYLKRDQMA